MNYIVATLVVNTQNPLSYLFTKSETDENNKTPQEDIISTRINKKNINKYVEDIENATKYNSCSIQFHEVATYTYQERKNLFHIHFISQPTTTVHDFLQKNKTPITDTHFSLHMEYNNKKFMFVIFEPKHMVTTYDEMFMHNTGQWTDWKNETLAYVKKNIEEREKGHRMYCNFTYKFLGVVILIHTEYVTIYVRLINFTKGPGQIFHPFYHRKNGLEECAQ